MLLEGQAIEPGRAARGLSVWMAGLVAWIVTTVGYSVFRWYLFSDTGAYGSHDATEIVSVSLQFLSVASWVTITAGAWRWTSASDQRSLTWLTVGVLGTKSLLGAGYFLLSVTRQPGDFLEREALFEVIGHLWMLVTLLCVAVFVLLYVRMARLSESQGWSLSPTRVWAAVAGAALWGLLVALARFELFHLGGLLRELVDVGVIAVVAGTALALLHSHRAHLREGAIAAAAPTTEPVAGLAEAGRGLGRYHGATISQIVFLIVGNLLTIAAAKGGDAEAARGMMVVVLVISLAIQLVAVAGLARFARHLPFLHDAKSSASAAVGAQVLNLLLGLVSVGLVLRAFESGRLSLLFDLQDQLPVLEGLGTLLGCIAAVAVLSAIDRTGALGQHGQVGMLKAGIAAVGVAAMVFKLLDHRDIGAVGTLVLGLVLLVGAIVVAVSFLRLVRRAADAMQMQS